MPSCSFWVCLLFPHQAAANHNNGGKLPVMVSYTVVVLMYLLAVCSTQRSQLYTNAFVSRSSSRVFRVMTSSALSSTTMEGRVGLDLPTYEDVVEASGILKGVAHETPVLTSRTLNEKLNADVYIKCENFQRIGAFKFRGGFNALSHLTEEQRQAGVLTFSSGNHAQAIALSAKLHGCKATIVMPSDAPKLKVKATKGYGANVIFYDRFTEDREAIAKEIQQKEGAIFVPPYDQKYVIAGQGTAAKELFDTLRADHGVDELDYFFVCVGGGGLISGCALATHALSPKTKVIGVEPEAGNDAQQSMEKGEIVKIACPATIADGAQTQYIGPMTFAIMQDKVDRIITVTDDELVEGMRFFGERMKIIVEPTGCLGIAGLQKMVSAGEIPAGSKCGVLISGGNVDLARYCELVNA
uniref:Tryptophan synthase beta chain-like PALP domain-containing protein n=1 Tax=Grammatophora oceanica TaxID=210454 RepID=A0A7S1VGT2_9STRA